MGLATFAARKSFEFMIYLWGAPDVEDLEVKAKALADAGFTVMDWDPAELDILENYGLKGMVKSPTEETVRQVSSHPALWGYHLGDEPYPEEAFVPVAEKMRALERIDPDHIAFVNMLSTTGEFLRTYMKVVEPPMLSFDYYQWWWGSDRYFEKLEQFREEAVLAGVPLGSCIEVTANPGIERGDRTYLADNAQKLRQSVYTNLAYGVQSIEWFSAGNLFEPKSVTLTPWGNDVAALNHELKRIGPELAGLRSLDVYHTPPLARGTREAPKEHWVQLLAEERKGGLVYGMFEDGKDNRGVDYVLVANKDYVSSQSVTMRLQSKWLGIAPWHEKKVPSYGIEKLDKASGAWETISSTSFVGFTFVIGAADGELFRITTTIDSSK